MSSSTTVPHLGVGGVMDNLTYVAPASQDTQQQNKRQQKAQRKEKPFAAPTSIVNY
jgi:hypothetical protein